MADYIDNSLLAMQKSLRDVILPAVDANDPLAREQLGLAIDYLGFLRQRLDFVVPRLWFEIDHYSELARTLIGLEGAQEHAARLRATLDRVSSTKARHRQTPASLREQADALIRDIDRLVEACCRAGSANLSAIEKAVVAASDVWVDLELSWYAPIGVAATAVPPQPLAFFLGGTVEEGSDASAASGQ